MHHRLNACATLLAQVEKVTGNFSQLLSLSLGLLLARPYQGICRFVNFRPISVAS